jgi:hypothetical protein
VHPIRRSAICRSIHHTPPPSSLPPCLRLRPRDREARLRPPDSHTSESRTHDSASCSGLHRLRQGLQAWGSCLRLGSSPADQRAQPGTRRPLAAQLWRRAQAACMAAPGAGLDGRQTIRPSDGASVPVSSHPLLPLPCSSALFFSFSILPFVNL